MHSSRDILFHLPVVGFPNPLAPDPDFKCQLGNLTTCLPCLLISRLVNQCEPLQISHPPSYITACQCPTLSTYAQHPRSLVHLLVVVGSSSDVRLDKVAPTEPRAPATRSRCSQDLGEITSWARTWDAAKPPRAAVMDRLLLRPLSVGTAFSWTAQRGGRLHHPGKECGQPGYHLPSLSILSCHLAIAWLASILDCHLVISSVAETLGSYARSKDHRWLRGHDQLTFETGFRCLKLRRGSAWV